jgi:hypothetical protein
MRVDKRRRELALFRHDDSIVHRADFHITMLAQYVVHDAEGGLERSQSTDEIGTDKRALRLERQRQRRREPERECARIGRRRILCLNLSAPQHRQHRCDASFRIDETPHKLGRRRQFEPRWHAARSVVQHLHRTRHQPYVIHINVFLFVGFDLIKQFALSERNLSIDLQSKQRSSVFLTIVSTLNNLPATISTVALFVSVHSFGFMSNST